MKDGTPFPARGATVTRGPFDVAQHVTEVRARFERQELTPAQMLDMKVMTERFANFAAHITENTPVSRQQSLALTALQEAKFWANDAIAHNKGASA